MKKEFALIIGLALVILVGLFTYILKDIPDYKVTLLNEVFYEPLENYTLTETEQGSFVENSNIGLKMAIPSGWLVKKIEGLGMDNKGVKEGAIAIYSPDSEVNEATSIAYKGCGISARCQISQKEKQFHIIASTIEDIQTGNEIAGSELVSVSGMDALWEIVLDEEEIGKAIMVSLPIDDKVHIFETVLPPSEKERCEKEFRDFLTKIEVTKK